MSSPKRVRAATSTRGFSVLVSSSQDQRLSKGDKPRVFEVKDVERHLLPRGLGVMPRNWTPWGIPLHPVPIDMEIKRLVNARCRPRLREREDLRCSGILCPYWYARSATISAVSIANKRAAYSKAEIQEQAKSISSLLRKVKIFRKNLPGLIWASSIDGVDGVHDQRSQATQEPTDVLSDLARLPNSLEYIEKFLTAARRERMNNQRDYWKYAFVDHLGMAWFKLTGSRPTNAGHFNGFVEAAWYSLSGHMPETRWDWTIRKVIRINNGVWDRLNVILIPQQEKGDLLRKLNLDFLSRPRRRG
jgi:hypothetical protein